MARIIPIVSKSFIFIVLFKNTKLIILSIAKPAKYKPNNEARNPNNHVGVEKDGVVATKSGGGAEDEPLLSIEEGLIVV